jgi:hypothetical protein
MTSQRRRVVAAGDPGGPEERVLELFVPRACWEFTADRGSGAPCYRGDDGVRGQVPCGGEGAGVADGQEYRRCGLDADSRIRSASNSATMPKTLNSSRPTGSVGSWVLPPRLSTTGCAPVREWRSPRRRGG